jgi:endo-1,4-beta-xylanase
MDEAHAAPAGLWKRYAGHFRIGAAVNRRTLDSHARLLAEHFNSITAENEMKWGSIEPNPDDFRFEVPDRMAAFATARGIGIRGHTLVWHNQTPAWVFSGGRMELAERMRRHIQAVVGRYRGRIYCWDVVNEAVADAGGDRLRASPWLEGMGEDYIAHAFQLAHGADPDATLFYNDYNETDPGKRAKIHGLVGDLRREGVPVHGIGLQGHWRLDAPSARDIRASLDLYASLGVRLQVTELDVSVHAGREPAAGAAEPAPELLERQAERYAEIFAIFREYRAVIDAVTLWGIADDATWLDNFPVRGRKDWPLLFDTHHRPKPAFAAVARGVEPAR